MFIVGTAQGVRLTKSVRRTGQPWKVEHKLAESMKGLPWDYHLGTLGSRLVPQARTRVPNAVNVPAIAPLPGLMPPPGGLPSVPARSDRMLGAYVAPAVPPQGPVQSSDSQQQQPPSVMSATPSTRPRLILSRDHRTPAAETPMSPMEVAGSDPPTTPEEAPLLPDPAMLSELVPGASRHEVGGDAGDAEARPSKIPRIRRIAEEEMFVNDEELCEPPEWQDPAVYAQWIEPVSEQAQSVDASHDFKEESDVAHSQGFLSKQQLKELESNLWFDAIPTLDAEAQQELDNIADEFEVQRLLRKKVLVASNGSTQADESSQPKRLSTTFVRTWRSKTKDGKQMFLRRSRLCAREFKWLDQDRTDVFTATNAAVTRLVPWHFASKRKVSDNLDDPQVLLGMDIKDAYLSVSQGERVIATMPKGYAAACQHEFERCIPGQRSGAGKWREHFIAFLKRHMDVEICKACPTLIAIGPGKMLTHVDDLILSAPKSWVLEHFIPTVEAEFECTWSIAEHDGDSVHFLQREHMVTPSGVVIRSQPELYQKMCEVLGVAPQKSSRTPCSKEIIKPTDAKPLDEDQTSKFRTAIGIAMYVSADRSDASFAIRSLSQRLANPSVADWKAAQKLGAYLRATEGYGILIAPSDVGSSILEPEGYSNASRGHLLEVFSDADWSGSQMNRRSMSGAVFYLDGAAVFASCRGQKCVSLSSCESEWHAAVSASCDLLYLKQCLDTILDGTLTLKVRLDNSAAKSLACREGPSGKTRHVDARLFWVQEKVKAGEINFASVPGLLNPADIATKVLTERRLKALLGSQHVVDVQNSMELVGQSEWHELLEQQAVTSQIRRITNQVNRRSTFSQAFLRVAVISMLMSGAEGHLSVAESSVQTEATAASTGWMYASFVLCIALLATMWMHLSLEPATPQVEVTGDASEEPNASVCNISTEREMQSAWTDAHDVWKYLCIMLMMYLGYLQLTVYRFRRKLADALDRLNAFEPDAEPSEEESEGERAPAQTSSRATTMHTNVHDPVMGNQQAVRQVQVPNEVSVTTTGRCFHHPSCHVLRNQTTGNVRRLRMCNHCRNVFG